jgi:DNA polymerase III subunit gamma/tau
VTYEPLHHKYRPQTFAALVGQQAIATTLTHALRQQRIAPAYLFTGARGTGKTSSARIFAKSLNCLKSQVPTENPCGVCEVCRAIAGGSALDVIEIDAASNTGVDNIRDLIDRSQFAPVQCRYKVYVIDECHMLSTAAFNALLKTLEEPPDRVVFVLATTDPQRVLPTIISRCQRFDFRRIPLEEMVTHLSAIASQEQINVSPDALNLIAQISQGGLRDAESLLDQLSLLEGQVTVDRVWDLVGAVPERDLLELVQAIAQDNAIPVLELTRRLMDRGREPLIVLQNLASFYRDLLIAKTAPDRQDLVSITPPTWAELCQFAQSCDLGWILLGQRQLRGSELQVKSTTQPRLWLEVTLMGLLPANSSPSLSVAQELPVPPPSALRQPQSAPTVHPTTVAPLPPESATSAPRSPSMPLPLQLAPELPEQAIASTEPPTEPSTVAAEDQSNLSKIWQQVLGLVQPFSTRTMLSQQCHLIAFTDQEVRVGTNSQPLFKMAKDRMPNIQAAFAEFCGHPIRVSLEVVVADDRGATEEAPPSTPLSQECSDHPSSPPGSPISSTDLPSPPSETSAADPTDHPILEPPDLPSWQDEDEVTKAAKSLAQMFNGQVVDLEDMTANPISGELAFQQELAPVEEKAEDEENEDEDDEDEIPF